MNSGVGKAFVFADQRQISQIVQADPRVVRRNQNLNAFQLIKTRLQINIYKC